MADQGAGLLLLREADVVRLCGLSAAAHALDVARAGRVTDTRKVGAQLRAQVRGDTDDADDGDDADDAAEPWLESRNASTGSVLAWGCTCPHGKAAAHHATTVGAAGLACVHVAALLTEWVRHPATFREQHATDATSAAFETAVLRPPARAAPRVSPPADPLVSSVRTDAPLHASLRDLLHHLPATAREQAWRTVLDESGGSLQSADMHVAALHDALTDPVMLSALCARLDVSALLLLRGVVVHGGVLTDAALAALGERCGLTQAAQVVARHALRMCCLLFPVGGDNSPAGWTVPAEIRVHLDLGLGLRALDERTLGATGIRGTHNMSGVLLGDTALRGLCLAITLMAHTHARLRPRGTTGTAAAAQSRRAVNLLVPSDEGVLAALGTWARAAGIGEGVARFSYRLVRAALERSSAPQPMLALNTLPPEEWASALKLTVSMWLDARTVDELADLGEARSSVRVRFDPGHAAFSPADLASEHAAARARVMRLLALVRPGTWHALDDLLTCIWRLDPYFLRARQRAFAAPAWWFEDAPTGHLLRPGVEPEWRRAEGEYIRALITGPLYWFGMVDLSRDASGHVVAFRCTAWAPYLFGISGEAPADAARLAAGWGPAVRPAGASELSVQPLALAPTGSEPLAAWADVSSVRGGRLIWQLSPDRYCAKLDEHQNVSVLLSWLQALDARDGTRAAQHAAALMERWHRQYSASHIRRDLVVVEARNEPELHEALAAVPELASEVAVIAPGIATLPRHHVDRLQQALAARGYFV